MSNSLSFVQHFNHVCSKMEWKVVSDDYDYNQEIATSCYGDMLHDTERNQKFGFALEKAIKKMHSQGRKAHVLDIGTGTGLLSMLAVKYGADSVVACEAFTPVADCAINIIHQNNFSDQIKVVKKHSTALTVGSDGDLEHKVNILVSEVFDTELIGEGAIKTFNHAHEHLLEDDCIVIPSLGTVYAQVVESHLATSWNQLKDWTSKSETLIKIPDKIKKCPGAAAVHDIQLSQLDHKLFKPLTKCLPVFRFDWSSKNPIPTLRHSDVQFKAVDSGKTQVIFMWWDLVMDPEGEIILSCAPVWEHPCSKDKYLKEGFAKGNPAKDIPWRDHWMQAVYFLNKESHVTQGEYITLNCYHDEFSFWFKVNDGIAPTLEKHTVKSLRPVCNCCVHFSMSRTRIGAINCERRRRFYLENYVKSDCNYVVFGDMSLLGLLIAKLGGNKVDILESSPPISNVIKTIAEYNGLDNVTVCSNMSQIVKNVMSYGSSNVSIISEPFFRNSVLPWDNITLWYMKEDLIKFLKPKLSNISVSPGRARMIACAVQFDDLWKIARRLNFCEGFSMKLFDDLIEGAKAKAESYMEPQPLWEYPGIALTTPFTLFDFNFSEDIPTKIVQRDGKIEFPSNCRCDGVAVWMEYCMNDSWLSTGPVDTVSVNEYISWDMFERQGVHLFRNSRKVNQNDILNYEVKFFPESGEFNFKFSINPS
ncbi:UNVERIFIED_CONTAM: hypothetical protein PYX00_007077 [Menopon gallinae]